jgi:hypothetical protein
LKCPVCQRLFTEIHHQRCSQCDEYRREDSETPHSGADGKDAKDDSSAASSAAAAVAAAPRWGDCDGEYGVHYMELRQDRAAGYDEVEGAGSRSKRDEDLEYKEEPVSKDCLVCNLQTDEDKLLACSACESKCHLACCSPPLERCGFARSQSCSIFCYVLAVGLKAANGCALRALPRNSA